ncbi:MAG: hypothetical protein P1U44_13265 [Vicingaceae bacterium]|jgi:hypothetical protein|nr:hypothetical protein [Vicingaceae bacterium]
MEITFNKIYVIESLPDNETKTGTDLHNDIIRRRLWSHKNISSELNIINSKLEFLNLFETVKTEIKENKIIPYFHFEIHGNKNGFFLKSNEQVNWIELHHRLMELNMLVKNNTWLSLATCFGAYIYSIVKPTDRSPFYGYIGPWEEIDIRDIPMSYERFFETLLENFDIKEAVKALNLSNPHKPIDYKIYDSNSVFQRVFDKYETDFYKEPRFSERLEQIANDGINDPRNEGLNLTREFFIDNAKGILLNEKEDIRNRYFEKFHMIDLYPENRERFE